VAHDPAQPLADGSTPEHQTSWPTVQESLRILGAPVDEVRALLVARGIYTNPHDRLPFEVVRAALADAGWEPKRLDPARLPGPRSPRLPSVKRVR
jgi:hypothetical protein